MANPSKAQGTTYENRILKRLKEVYGPVERSAAGTKYRDFTGTRWPCEAKKWDVPSWRIPTWTRGMRDTHGRNWVLFVGPKDLRRKDSAPEMMVVPFELGLSLLEAYERDART